MKYLNCCLFLLFLCQFSTSYSQSYHATNGSAYAGVLSNFTNPASAINSPLDWDFSFVGAQSNTINKGVRINNFRYSNLTPSKIDKIIVQPSNGYSDRSIENNADAHLFNFRKKINDNSCFSFGIRLRSYNRVAASAFAYTDTISGFYSFLHYNAGRGNVPFNFQAYSAAWLENDFSYSAVLNEDYNTRLTGGVTVAILRGISGVYGGLNDVTYSETSTGIHKPTLNNNTTISTFYSDNFSATDDSYSDLKNLQKAKSAAKYGVGFSFGVEYIVKDHLFEEPYSPEQYKWKLGVSIMDIGTNKFVTSNKSMYFHSLLPTATDTGLNNQINEIWKKGLIKKVMFENFRDSLALNEKYTMSLPTRLVASIDRNLGDGFYINGMFNINFYSSAVVNMYKIKTAELNRVIITPRWENRHFGFYMPTQYTAKQNIMVGMAAKIGPLLIGLHNIMWLQRTTLQELNGGGYVALHFYARDKRNHHHSLDCY